MNRALAVAFAFILVVSLAGPAVADFSFDADGDVNVIEDFNDVSEWTTSGIAGGDNFIESEEEGAESDTPDEAPEGPNLSVVGLGSGSNSVQRDIPNSSYDDLAIWFRFNENVTIVGWDQTPRIRINGPNGGVTDITIWDDVSGARGEWFRLRVTFDWTAETYDYRIVNRTGVEQANSTGNAFTSSNDAANEFQFFGNLAEDSRKRTIFADYLINGSTRAESFNHTVSGFVKDADGDPIANASVETNTSQSAVSGTDGSYTLRVDNGTYEITATDDEGDTGSITVTVNGSNLNNQNITILDEELTIDVASAFMEHGSTQDFAVLFGSSDVTAQATVTSSNTSVVSVDKAAKTLTATSDESVNKKVTISATYQGETVEQDITVANKTLDNIAILPPATWPSAIIGQPGDTTGSSGTWPGAIQLQWLFVCLSLGAVVSWRSVNPFMGLASVEILLAFGWAISWISDGLLIASIIFLVYASLSLTDIASGNLGTR